MDNSFSEERDSPFKFADAIADARGGARQLKGQRAMECSPWHLLRGGRIDQSRPERPPMAAAVRDRLVVSIFPVHRGAMRGRLSGCCVFSGSSRQLPIPPATLGQAFEAQGVIRRAV